MALARFSLGRRVTRRAAAGGWKRARGMSPPIADGCRVAVRFNARPHVSSQLSPARGRYQTHEGRFAAVWSRLCVGAEWRGLSGGFVF